jgi:hypothetical protein
MTWTERVVGAVFGILITGGLLLTVAYGPHYLVPLVNPPSRVLFLVHAAICIFLTWQLVRAYRTGSIRRRRLPPIERRDRPFAFWVCVSSYVLLILMFGPLWALTRALGPI